MQYEREKATSHQMEPDVIEFACHFDLSERHSKSLNEQLKTRNNTYDEDLAALYEILGRCNNSAQRADLLNMNVRWMKEGIFHGEYGPNAEVVKAAKKYKLAFRAIQQAIVFGYDDVERSEGRQCHRRPKH